MESSQKQQPVHVISFCVFCFPQLHCWSHGLLLSRLALILLSIMCYAFRSLNTMSFAADVIVLQICTMLRRAAGIITHTELIAGALRFRSDSWIIADTCIRAYAAYISGILINVVGFAGASASCCVSWSFYMLTNIFYKAGRNVPLAATRVYQMSFFTGFGVSSLIYFLLNFLFPVPGSSLREKFWEVDLSNAYVSKSTETANDDTCPLPDKKRECTAVAVEEV